MIFHALTYCPSFESINIESISKHNIEYIGLLTKFYLYNKTHWHPFTMLGREACKNSYNSEEIKVDSTMRWSTGLHGVCCSRASSNISLSLLLLPEALTSLLSRVLSVCLLTLTSMLSLLSSLKFCKFSSSDMVLHSW